MSFLRFLFCLVVIFPSTFCFAKSTEGTVKSQDGLSIAYRSTGSGPTALVFVHGWTGNMQWWSEQEEAFADRYQVVALDLAGHGKSDKNRTSWTAQAYGQDIRAVCDDLNLQKIVLIGHSMSGTNSLAAYSLLEGRVKALVPVDTLHDLDHEMPDDQITAFFTGLKEDWLGTMEKFSSFVYTDKTPPAVKEKLEKEMAAVDPSIAIPALEAVFRTDPRPFAVKVAVPVRAIQGDLAPTNLEANRKYFNDYDYRKIDGYGHFPMLEAPELFNQALEDVLRSVGDDQ